ncbi:MAG: rRNA maturation RNase YbeY [Acidimicrobiales bacterium]|nr:rRNA maturation RNase YbeY [Acidimicrobiales bacterium]
MNVAEPPSQPARPQMGEPPRRRRGGPGSLAVFVADEQTDHPVDLERWERLVRDVLAAEGVEGDVEVALTFVDESAIAELKRTYLDPQAEGPTDVLSFPIDDVQVTGGRWPDAAGPGPGRTPDPDDAPLLLGDVVVCPAVAARQAPTHAGSYDDELALLIVHGLLHLLGMDHTTEAETASMRERERALLTAYHGVPTRDPWAD